MARKRGGVAGFWDRNKQYIKPVATLAAGALTGGVGGAVVGGLMNGMDRPGKGGIGFDVGKGALGAATGYGMGKMGGALKSGIMNRLGSQAASQVVGSAAPRAALYSAAPTTQVNIAGIGAKTLGGGMMRDFAAETAANMGGANPSMLGSLGSSAGNFLKDGKTISALGSTAVGAMNAYGQSQQNALARQQMERNNRLEDEDREREQGMDPVRARLLAMMMQRLGGASMGARS